jgi:hypothetical protein
MSDENWNKEFHEIMVKFAASKRLTPSQIMSFLTVNFIGTLYNCGYDESFVDATLDRMKSYFREFKAQHKDSK